MDCIHFNGNSLLWLHRLSAGGSRCWSQWFEVDLTLWLDLSPGQGDAVEDTLDYRNIISRSGRENF